MQKIIPHLWFDKNASEAVAFYVTVFPNSQIQHSIQLRNTPSGDCDLLNFTLNGQELMAMGAGPEFRPTPAASFIVNYDPALFGNDEAEAKKELDRAWAALSEGGQALMPLDEYPFSKHYGWIQDRYGVSWQLMLSKPEGEPRPFIVPSLMFTGHNAGRASEAIDYYCSIFPNARKGAAHQYPEGSEQDPANTLMYADFQLEDIWIACMDSGYPHAFNFNEAFSLVITCADQEEIDYYANKLSADPRFEQCGWLKDKFGLSWQVSSAELETIMREGTQDEIDRVTQAIMPMKKLDIQKIHAAAKGDS
ncbi:VOC family protein [Rurimicrobium arvi]|uniref:VOC family protein n=1 Tax=Rurimicrobium arvi TaxID=2049916 RepID=A0ABP8MRR6_9BACT